MKDTEDRKPNPEGRAVFVRLIAGDARIVGVTDDKGNTYTPAAPGNGKEWEPDPQDQLPPESAV